MRTALIAIVLGLAACATGAEHATRSSHEPMDNQAMAPAMSDSCAMMGNRPGSGGNGRGAQAHMAAANAEAGREIFNGRGNCSTCHGPGGTGSPLAPDLTDDTTLHLDGSPRAVHHIVMHGVPQPRVHPAPMPPRGGADLSHADVMDVAAYVMTLDD